MGTGRSIGSSLARPIEVLALLPSTVFLAPLLLYGGVGIVFAIVTELSSGRPARLGPLLFLLTQMWVAAACIVSLWIVLLIGSNKVRRTGPLFWGIVMCLALGLMDAGHFLSSPGILVSIKSSALSALTWTAMLGFPMIAGTRDLFLLLWGRHKPA
jgi:hypothetical protein